MLEHDYIDYANQTHQWMATDSEERFKENCQDLKKLEYLRSKRLLDKNVIQYKFNRFGFRCSEWNNILTYNIALGCSHTQGIGLNANDVWPKQLSNILKKSVLNFGIGGSSLDTCLRILQFAIDNVNIDTVYLLEPESCRFEFAVDNKWTVLTVNHHHPVYKHWAVEEKNININQLKNRLAIKYLCNINNIKLKTLTIDQISPSESSELDWARDFAHNGPLWHKRVAKQFAEL